jgi:hypothetical protein
MKNNLQVDTRRFGELTMILVATKQPEAWCDQWLPTRLHGDIASAVSASAQDVHTAPAGFLVLKSLTEATAPCTLLSES